MEQPDRLSNLEKRIAELERRLGSPSKVSWLRSLLRIFIILPLVGLPLIFALEFASRFTEIPLVILGAAIWCGTVVLWLVIELFIGNSFRFSLIRLLLVMVLFSVIFAGWHRLVWEPLRIEKMTLASINGLTKSVHKKPQGPKWLRARMGDEQFERATQIEIKEPGGDDDVPKLNNLPYVHYVFLTGPGFTDEAVEHLKHSVYLTDVVLTGAAVSKQAVDSLRQERPNLDLKVQSTPEVR